MKSTWSKVLKSNMLKTKRVKSVTKISQGIVSQSSSDSKNVNNKSIESFTVWCITRFCSKILNGLQFLENGIPFVDIHEPLTHPRTVVGFFVLRT